MSSLCEYNNIRYHVFYVYILSHMYVILTDFLLPRMVIQIYKCMVMQIWCTASALYSKKRYIKLFYFDIKQIYHFWCCFIVYDTRYPIIVFCKPSSISYTPLLSCSVKCQCNIKSLVKKILCIYEAVVNYGN